MKKYIALSNKSLEKILNYAEKNKDNNKICLAYIDACCAVYHIGEIYDKLLYKDLKRIDFFNESVNTYRFRDQIGRIILRKINKDNKN